MSAGSAIMACILLMGTLLVFNPSGAFAQTGRTARVQETMSSTSRHTVVKRSHSNNDTSVLPRLNNNLQGRQDGVYFD